MIKKNPPSLQNQHLDDITAHPFPKKVNKGQFRRFKTAMSAFLLLSFFIGPFLHWDRGVGVPNQLLFLDITHRIGYFFNLYLWPQHMFLFAFVMLLGFLALFLAATLMGRIWCGFACPQTVFSDLFMGIERILESKNADLPLLHIGFLGGIRRLIKHLAWLGFGFIFSWSLLTYFNPKETLLSTLLSGHAGFWMYTFFLGVPALIYLTAGFMRERICVYVCPYSRFQTVLQDDQTLLISYRTDRGDPKGSPKDKTNGDCVDCSLCHNVCPTGVDIRKGLSVACISCGLCIDACNSVMKKLRRDKNLIGFFSTLQLKEAATNKENNKEKNAPLTPAKRLRPRTLSYMALMVFCLGFIIIGWFSLKEVNFQLDHIRAPLTTVLEDGRVGNAYQVHIVNKSLQPHIYILSLAPKDKSLFKLSSERDPRVENKDQQLWVSVSSGNDVSFRMHVLTLKEAVIEGKHKDLSIDMLAFPNKKQTPTGAESAESVKKIDSIVIRFYLP